MTFSFISPRRMRLRVLATAIVLGAGVPIASAQVAGRAQELETRAELTARVEREERAGHKANAAYLRARLRDGDFQEGNRVVILLENMPSIPGRPDLAAMNKPDTLIVRSGRVLQFPQAKYQGVQDLQVGGLLQSELADKVKKQFEFIYTNPIMRVIPLMELTISGAVTRGGTIDVPPDQRLNDVFTYAGLAADADLKKMSVRRGAQEFMSAKQLEQALNNSVTVDGAHLRAGDQIIVPRKTASNWMTYVGLGLSLLGVVLTLQRAGGG